MPRPAPHILGRLPQRSFEHLVNTQRKADRTPIPTRIQSRPTFVPVKDRIPLWNISSGDRVRLVSGAKRGRIGTVDYVDREKNRVYLLEAEFCRQKQVPTERKGAIFNDPRVRPNQSVLSQVPIHYSNLALILQRPDASVTINPDGTSTTKSSTTDVANGTTGTGEVVAKRVRATGVRYDWKRRTWTWRRLAESVAELDPVTGHSSALEWDREDRFTPFVRRLESPPKSASVRDTSHPASRQATFVPSLDPINDVPRELSIREMEFVNVHGRAKKMQRYKAKKELESQIRREDEQRVERARRMGLGLSRTAGAPSGTASSSDGSSGLGEESIEAQL